MEMSLVFPFCVPVAAGIVFVYGKSPRVFETGVEIARVTPSLPQWGRQPKGARPLDTPRALDFSFTLPKYDPQPCSTGRAPMRR